MYGWIEGMEWMDGWMDGESGNGGERIYIVGWRRKRFFFLKKILVEREDGGFLFKIFLFG